jgi:hypothetical protein
MYPSILVHQTHKMLLNNTANSIFSAGLTSSMFGPDSRRPGSEVSEPCSHHHQLWPNDHLSIQEAE